MFLYYCINIKCIIGLLSLVYHDFHVKIASLFIISFVMPFTYIPEVMHHLARLATGPATC